MTKKLILIAFMAMSMMFKINAQTTVWKPDVVHSTVMFSVKHMGISNAEGKFKKFDGTVASTNADFSDAVVSFTVDVASASTDNDQRDGHLKGDDFFNAEKYPQMKFVSTSFKKIDDKNYTLEGLLTIRDVTKKVTFNVVYGGTTKGMRGNNIAGFTATTTIARKDFNVTAGKASMAVGDNVTITVNLELAQQ